MVHIFISHSWSYGEHYEGLKRLLNQDSNFKWKNYSVPKNDPIHYAKNSAELREAIRRQIAPASVVLILAGVYATYSKWINIEIELAKCMKKPIVAIEYWGSERTSQVVKKSADKIVRWNSSSIIHAIHEVL